MSKKDNLKWSADLRRIALWLQTGNIVMANKFIKRGKDMYQDGKNVGGREWKWWFSEISRKDYLKASERALTWSLLLK
jgi:hypothetical protein